MQLSVAEQVRDRVWDVISSNAGPDATCFDHIHADVAYELRYDIFPRFIRSPHYFKLASLTLEERAHFDIEQFDLCRLLGAGGFGMVLLVRRHSHGNFFACKVIDKRIVISQNQVHALLQSLKFCQESRPCSMRFCWTVDHAFALSRCSSTRRKLTSVALLPFVLVLSGALSLPRKGSPGRV